MWPTKVVVICLAVAVALASAATWSVQQWRWTAKHERELRQMLQAGADAANKRDLQINSLREQSLEDADRIAGLSGGGRVYCATDAPPNRLPTNPDAGRPEAAGAGREDVTELLEAFLKCGGQVNRALGVK